ncbi:mesothelin-like protein [Pogoniulus pusillus]|uniref:mesothelin-like protein n=1 Tax=Pogoniulus pusillus TaxID=488313 RepID=UPI0030B99B47
MMQAALAALMVGAALSTTEPHAHLGALVCDMEPETIKASAPGVLENLKLCSALTGAQQDALNAVLLGGDTVYGDPSSWDFQTLQHLGPLVLALNQTTLSLVAKVTREAFGRSIKAAYSRQGHSQREKSLLLLRALVVPPAAARPRRKRNAKSCTSTPVTPSTILDFIIDDRDSEDFDLCLSNEFVKEHLELLMELPLPNEFKLVVKNRLKQVYPNGIPEGQLKVLGDLSCLYTAEEISQWNVTSSDTLLALLNEADGKCNDAQIQQMISMYLDLGGSWSGAVLQRMGGENLCQLQEEQIEQIPPEALRTAGQLNISSCSQAKKEKLYRKSKQAFADQTSTIRTYYCRIRPYLGGAPAEDLKELAEAGTAIDMDIDTFLALNPDELEKLSVTDVRNLLGGNLSDLKEAENESSVMRWLKRQPQKELDLLNLGLQGGIPEPTAMGTTSSPRPTATATTSPKSAVPTAPTTLPTTTATSSRPTAVSTTSPPGTINPNTTSPSSAPPSAPTHEPNTTTSTVPNPVSTTHNTSTPLASVSPPAPGGTTHPAPATQNTTTPSTHSVPSTFIPNSTTAPAATTTTDTNPPSKPTPVPSSTLSSVVSSTAKTTTLDCKTGTPPTSLQPSSTTTTTTKETPPDMPEPPTPNGYINLKPEPGSGSMLSCCLLAILTAAVGSSLLPVLL